MPSPNTMLKWIVALVGCVVLGFTLLVGLAAKGAQIANMTQGSGCSAPLVVSTADAATPLATERGSASPLATTPPAGATPTATSDGESFCYPASHLGAQVVSWARAMADALYVQPACGSKRGGACNDTYYTSAFPSQVIQYGQAWCRLHGHCEDWANGSYQCVSFVRGAYSQVYPMTVTNDAFNLWASYQHLPGWQEIPAAATPDVTQRFVPEAGDVMVFQDHFVGHVAIVLQVQPPANGQNGWVAFANANSSSAYDRMPLQPNLLVDTSRWNSNDPQHSNTYTVWGYIRPKLKA